MIKTQADLKKLFQLCRKQGITELELGNIKFKLGELPIENKSQVDEQEESESDDPYANFPAGVLTPEQLMYYSSGGLPENEEAN